MEEFWINWILLIGVFGIAVISPGPDFVMAVRNSVLYSRRTGLLTALGFALGLCVHMTYTFVGIAALIQNSLFLFSLIKYMGAAYLFYLGYKAFKSTGFEGRVIGNQKENQHDISRIAALRSGFLTNVLNPKATLFCLAVFTQFIGPGTALNIQLIYATTCFIMCWGWFSIVALILTNQTIRRSFLKFSSLIDRVCGIVFIGLGLKLALSKS